MALSNKQYPLVADRQPGQPIVGLEHSPRQKALLTLGFQSDWWLPPELASGWRTTTYPIQATRISVRQWEEFQTEVARDNMGAAQAVVDYSDLENDLATIRQFDHSLLYPVNSLGWLETEWERRETSRDNLTDLFTIPGVNLLQALSLKWWREQLSPRNLSRLIQEYAFMAGTADADWRLVPVDQAAATLWARRDDPPPRIPASVDEAAYLLALREIHGVSPHKGLPGATGDQAGVMSVSPTSPEQLDVEAIVQKVKQAKTETERKALLDQAYAAIKTTCKARRQSAPSLNLDPLAKLQRDMLDSMYQGLLMGTFGDQGGTVRGERQKRNRGPKPNTDRKKDKRLCEDWKAAKRQGMTREAFGRERGITVQDLIAAMDREKYRRTRDAE